MQFNFELVHFQDFDALHAQPETFKVTCTMYVNGIRWHWFSLIYAWK